MYRFFLFFFDVSHITKRGGFCIERDDTRCGMNHDCQNFDEFYILSKILLFNSTLKNQNFAQLAIIPSDDAIENDDYEEHIQVLNDFGVINNLYKQLV